METYARHDPGGRTILATGRYLKPVGRHLAVGRFPYGLAMSRDGKTLFVASDGVGQIITDWRDEAGRCRLGSAHVPIRPRVARQEGRPTNSGGADFSPDGRILYWSVGEIGAIDFFDVASRRMVAEVSLNAEVGGRKFDDSYVVDVKAVRRREISLLRRCHEFPPGGD